MYAQTNIQLYNQLLRDGYSETDLAAIRDAYELSVQLFTGRYQSSGKDFIAHGVATASILADMSVPANVVAAGMLHNAYRSGDFGSLKSNASSTKRKRICNQLGEEVEQYVYGFHRLEWWGAEKLRYIRDNLAFSDSFKQFVVLIRLADLLEHLLDFDLLYSQKEVGEMQRKYFEENGSVIVEIAAKLGFPDFARELDRVLLETAKGELPEEFLNIGGNDFSYVIPPKSFRKKTLILVNEIIKRVSAHLKRAAVSVMHGLPRPLVMGFRRLRTKEGFR